MKEFSFPYVSVASSGGEYFQVSFADGEESDHSYFLIQRQFESDDVATFTLRAMNAGYAPTSKSGKQTSGEICCASNWLANQPKRSKSDFKPTVLDITN